MSSHAMPHVARPFCASTPPPFPSFPSPSFLPASPLSPPALLHSPSSFLSSLPPPLSPSLPPSLHSPAVPRSLHPPPYLSSSPSLPLPPSPPSSLSRLSPSTPHLQWKVKNRNGSASSGLGASPSWLGPVSTIVSGGTVSTVHLESTKTKNKQTKTAKMRCEQSSSDRQLRLPDRQDRKGTQKRETNKHTHRLTHRPTHRLTHRVRSGRVGSARLGLDGVGSGRVVW